MTKVLEYSILLLSVSTLLSPIEASHLEVGYMGELTGLTNDIFQSCFVVLLQTVLFIYLC